MEHNQDTEKMVWRCKMCGHKQSLSKSICEGVGCGADLSLYGEVIKVKPKAPSPKPDPDDLKKKIVIGIIIAVIAILGVIATAVIVRRLYPDVPAPSPSSGSPTAEPNTPAPSDDSDNDDEPNDQSSLIPATAPDFLTFANGYAEEDAFREDLDERYTRGYRLSKNSAETIIGEYLDLLTDNESPYQYRLIDSAFAQGTSRLLTYYWYRYTGDTDVTEFTTQPAASINIEDANLVITVAEYDDYTVAYVGPANEITLQDDGYRTTYVPAIAPDFLSFANGFAYELSLEGQEGAPNYNKIYWIDRNDADLLISEYVSLFEKNYSFGAQGSTGFENDGLQFTYFWFTYFGTANVAEFNIDLANNDRIKNTNFIIMIVRYEDGIYVDLMPANEITLQDDGYRTTFNGFALVPDFAAFAPDNVTQLDSYSEYLDDRYSHHYHIDRSTGDQVISNYMALLEYPYLYRLIDSAVHEGSDHTYTYYWYTYTGAADVATFDVSASGISIEDAAVLISIVDNDNDYIGCYIYLSNDIDIVDGGNRYGP